MAGTVCGLAVSAGILHAQGNYYYIWFYQRCFLKLLDECSIDRFKALSTENGRLRVYDVREAKSVLQVEMLGYYKNTVRDKYGKGINGPDFIVEGLGDSSNIPHI